MKIWKSTIKKRQKKCEYQPGQKKTAIYKRYKKQKRGIDTKKENGIHRNKIWYLRKMDNKTIMNEIGKKIIRENLTVKPTNDKIEQAQIK